MNRRRGVSFGTIAMLLVACITLCASFGVILTIREDEGNLAMDAEILLDSVTDLIALPGRYIGEDTTSSAKKDVQQSTSVQPEQKASTPTPTHNVMAAVAVTPTPRVKDETITLSITFAGGVAFESNVLAGAYDKAADAYRYNEMLSGISSAIHSDLNIAVLETLISENPDAANDLFSPPESVQTLASAGFDTAILCHENALSGGRESIEKTLNVLKNHGIVASGLSLPENESRFDILQINGLKLAILAYTDTVSSLGKKNFPDVQQREQMLRAFDEDRVKADIHSARNQGAQIVLVFMNWGTDDASSASDTQKKNAQIICDAGADILIGYNSICVQPVTILTSNGNSSHQMLTAWNMGKLLDEDRTTRAVVSGMLLHVQIEYDTALQAVRFDKVEYTPTYCWRQEENGTYPYRVVLSNLSVPEGMIQKQREILARSLVLIQTVMQKGIATQR